jgi:hypothetical protein
MLMGLDGVGSPSFISVHSVLVTSISFHSVFGIGILVHSVSFLP